MARLNTANPLVNKTPCRENEAPGSSARNFGIYPDSPISRDPCSSPRNVAKHNMPQRPQNQTRRQAKGSGGSFNIFSDDASASESETQQQKSAGKQQKHKTLGLARVNSLLLPGKQRPRRALRREVEGYDKENDVPEHATDGHRTPDVTPTRPNASQAPSRSRRENVSARQPEIDPYQEYEEQPELSCEEEDSSDSLDGFIVSDNDEPSSYETSDAEATDQEDEPSPPPSPVRSPRKRLMRGRKPNSETRPEPINTSKEEPSIEAKQLPQKLDQYVEREKAISREGDDCTPHLYQTSSIDKIDEADAFKTQLDSTSPIHPSLYNSNDLIRHLEDLELDSDNDSSPQPQTGRTSPSSEDKISLQPYPGRTKPPPSTPLRHKSHLSLTRSIARPESSVTMETPTTVRAQKKAEAARKREMRAQIAEFNDNKTHFAETFLRYLESAFSDQITRITEETGGIKLVWTKSFRNTAGRATVRTERVLTGPAGVGPPGRRLYHATIELSEQVLDSEDKILCTLTHEYCHLLDMIVSNNRGKGAAQHGASFQQWGARCIQALEGHPVYGGRVQVSTKHTYEINFKYVWTCEAESCAFKVGRHSKSVDPQRHLCGLCRGRLRQVKPVPRAVAPRKVAPKPKIEQISVVDLSI